MDLSVIFRQEAAVLEASEEEVLEGEEPAEAGRKGI